MSIMLKSPNSKPSPRAGGIWRASSNRSTASTRCGWAILPNAPAACSVKSPRCRLRRRHPRREHGARRRDGHRAGHGGRTAAGRRAARPESGIQVDYVQETVEEHAAKHPQQYDVVTCMEMLEHVPDPQSVVHACARLVKPGGGLLLHHQPQRQGLADGGSRGGICHEDGAQRHS